MFSIADAMGILPYIGIVIMFALGFIAGGQR